jgi:hypothetical protein
LDVVLDVAQHKRGAASLAANSALLYLRQGALQAKVLAVDGQSLELYIGAGNSPERNPWHTVWCRSLQAVQVLSIQLDTSEPQLAQASLDETLAFVVTFYARLQRVLSGLASSWLASGDAAGRTSGASAMSGWGGGWKGAGGMGAGGAQVHGALGSHPSLALLEEAKLWTAVLLRLARKLPVWRTQAPKLALFMVEQIPVLIGTLTEALILWKGDGNEDWGKFAKRFGPVSHHEQQLASMQAAASSTGREEPSKEALTRCAFYQLVLDALLAALHDSLRILCCCGDLGLTHVERSTKHTGSSSLTTDLIPFAAAGTGEGGLTLAPPHTLASSGGFAYGGGGIRSGSLLGVGGALGGAYPTATPPQRVVRFLSLLVLPVPQSADVFTDQVVSCCLRVCPTMCPSTLAKDFSFLAKDLFLFFANYY